MSEEQIRSKISEKQDELTKIEAEIIEKKISTEKEIESEYEPKINTTNNTLTTEEKNLEEAISKVAEWNDKMKELKGIVKNLTKELKSLNKEKEKALKNKLKQVNTEKKSRISTIQKEIKSLEKELKSLLKAVVVEE